MRNFQEILERIAKENGTTPDNVLQEMQRAIDEAFDHHDADAQPGSVPHPQPEAL